MTRVVHFEIPADNPERAVAFYEEVFDWDISKWEGPFDYWLASTGPDDAPGIHGAITPRDHKDTIIGIDVPSVDEFTAKVEESGGSVVMPKAPIPGIGYFAYCMDTEGNIFGIIESDASVQ